MFKFTSGVSCLCLGALFSSSIAAESMFVDSFEPTCLPDQDGDRLDGCQEVKALTDSSNPDTDSDGLSDGDEVLGTADGVDLPALGVSPRRKDILIEYDWFDDASESGGTCGAGLHSHRPSQAALDLVSVMFGAAPVVNPDGSSGINVVHDVGQGGALDGGNRVDDEDGRISGTVFGSDYDEIYNAHFSDNRRGYFHYVLLPHRYVTPVGDGSSGYAEVLSPPFNDEIIVSLACAASVDYLANTIAHELGHNLQLNHGGSIDDACNNKPNYNSIMNYAFQFGGVDTDCIMDGKPGPANFSSGLRAELDENALVEADGVCGGIATDWDFSGDLGVVKEDINGFLYPNQAAECSGIFTLLRDHDDWSNVVLPLRVAFGGGGGGSVDPFPGVECPTPPLL